MVVGSNPTRSLGNLYLAIQRINIPSRLQAFVHPPLGPEVHFPSRVTNAQNLCHIC